jgi:hypothetical protein
MGTNYYRIPKASEVEKKKELLESRIRKMPITPSSIERGFRYIETDSDLPYWDIANPWDEFVEGTNIHLGKRSSGWKFCWNFHNNQYYKDKESLLNFIRSGRVVNEYGDEMDKEEFITMALEWGQPNGLVADKEYFDSTNHHSWMSNPSDYFDKEIDGLRVSSSTEFS